MTYAEAIQFLYSLRWFGAKFGLANTCRLAALAGNPQNRLRFIHVAGTNGKGSTCAMLESIYRRAGLRVGLFTSPHLVSFGERIQVNREPIPENEIASLVGRMRLLLKQDWGEPQAKSTETQPAQRADEHPTFFEVVTVMALIYFTEQSCDLVIWETGLGGRLDATNIVAPIASIITNIQYDHQRYLGETLPGIAAEKAGIIKPGVPVITGTDGPEALRVITESAQRQGSPLELVDRNDLSRPPLDELQLPLLGEHQRMNAAVAIAAVRALSHQIPVDDKFVRAGLVQVHWPGRLHLIEQDNNRRILLDGAHNIGGVESLAAALTQYFPGIKPTLVLGILRDKDWPAMCEILAPLATRLLLVPVHSERTAEPHSMAEVCRRANPQIHVSEWHSLQAALAETSRDSFVTIAGSLYLIGEAMELLGLSPTRETSERKLNEWGGSGFGVRV